MTVASFVLWAIAFVSVLLAALLVLPVTVRARGHVDEDQIWGQLRAAWAWGMASATLSPEGRQVRILGWTVPQQPKRDRADRSAVPKKAPRRRPKLSQFLEHLPVLLKALWRVLSALHVRWSVEGQAGFDDPADTAVAALLVRQAALALPPRVRIAIEPDYVDSTVRLRSTLVVRLWPGEMIFMALRLLARRDVRHALRALRS